MSDTTIASVESAAPVKEREVVLDVRDVTRRFGDVAAVTGVRFRVHAGEIFGFVGPNGAGKSTTLRILATLDLPTTGDAFVGGHSVIEHPDRVRPLIGFMPDKTGFYDDTTVEEYLDFFARAYGLRGDARRERLRSVMDFTQLGDIRDKLLNTLSKGMKQRVVLGRTLLNDPKLLILDEPADGLDPRARIELRELLLALRDEGKAILISSHILTELSELCDGAVIIERGQLLAHGRVDEILDQSRSAAGAAKKGAEIRTALRAGDDLQARVARLEKVLLEQPGVADIKLVGPGARFFLDGGDSRAAELLRHLASTDLGLVAFHTKEADLEDAFMSITKGRVQ